MTIKFNNVGGNIEITTDSTRIYYGGAGTSGNFKPIDTNRGGELNGFLITLGGDCYSVAFDDLRINGYSPTTLLIAAEALQGLFSNTPYTPPPLILEYNNPANIPDYTLADWNEFFHLGGNDYYGIPFTSVAIEGANVLLRGGKDITLRENLYQDSTLIISVTDNAFCITSAENQVFLGCTNLANVFLPLLQSAGKNCFSSTSATTFDLPSLQSAGLSCFQSCSSMTSFDLPSLVSAGDYCFIGCTSATSFNLPLLVSAGDVCFADCTSVISFDLPSLQNAGISCFQNCSSATTFNLTLAQQIGNSCFKSCTSAILFNLPSVINLGETVGDDSVFNGVIGNTISLTILPTLMTCNAGEPDGDIIYLQDNNDVTITLV